MGSIILLHIVAFIHDQYMGFTAFPNSLRQDLITGGNILSPILHKHHIVCFAHATNRMAVHGEDFEKGADDGAAEALQIMAAGAALLAR